MKKKIMIKVVFMILMLTSNNGYSMNNDKEKHFYISTMLSFSVNNNLRNNEEYNEDKNRLNRFLFTSSFSLIPGIAKELIDSTKQTNKFDWRDIEYDILGVTTGFITSEFLPDDIFINIEYKEQKFFKSKNNHYYQLNFSKSF